MRQKREKSKTRREGKRRMGKKEKTRYQKERVMEMSEGVQYSKVKNKVTKHKRKRKEIRCKKQVKQR